MGEDRTMCAEKKQPNEVATYPCRHRHSSVISSCSEDAESESTSAGYPPSPDEERDEELEYGPGIVNKLRTRFLSITLKQNRGTNMRRSCSMENLLDQDRPLGRPFPAEKAPDSAPVKPPWGNLKRAKSMDTLLMEMHPDVDDHKAPKVVKSGLGRLMPTICDEELPKPDTVKTYKRMFEPAESRRGTHCRRPPVLRASARSSSGSKVNGVSPTPSAKVNGTSRSKFSAKQSPPVKAQSPDLFHSVNGSGKKSPSQESTKPLFNGVVKATPLKISSLRNGREIENLNSINRLLNKKEVHFAPKTDIICNGNMNHKDILKIKSNEDNVKQFTKNNLTNGNVKPKVPPNRPSLRSPKPLLKINEHTSQDVISPTKLKPILANGLRKSCEINNKSDLPKSPEPKSNDVSRIPREFHLKNRIKSPPLESKQKEDFVWPTENNVGIRIPHESDIKTEAIPTPEKKIKDIIQTLSESSVVKNNTHPLEKEPISKLTERTATISPDLNNLDKTFKAPTVLPPKVQLMQQFNTATELVNKPVNGFVDPVKKPTNEFVDPVKKPTNEFVDPVKKPVNEFVDAVKKPGNESVDPVKKPTNGFVDPVMKPANGFVDPVTKPANGFVDPVKKPMNGSATDKSPNKTPPPSQPEKKPGSLEPVRRSPVNGLPTTETAKKPLANGFAEPAGKVSKQPSHDSPDSKPGPSRPIKKSQAQSTSMVFDFRGKDVVPHVAVLPVPFGCKALHPKKRAETPEEEDEDEDYVDYSVPPPSGVIFEGENIKIGKGSILAIRNKDVSQF